MTPVPPMAPVPPATTMPAPVAPQAFDRSTLKPLDAATLTAEELIGTAVYDANNDNVGAIGDIMLARDGAVDAVIIDVGGFLGMGSKPVAVAYQDLDFQVDANNTRYLLINATRAQLEAQPAFDRDTWASARDSQRLVLMR
jgi:sporulation protein YlmC with PRC-barrel domain